MTVPTPDADKYYTVKLNDKITVQSKRPTEEQVVVLSKTASAVQRDPEGRAINGMGLIFRIFERMLTPESADLIDEALVDGTLKVSDLQNLILAGQDEETDDKPLPAKRVRRAR
jgi:hypothetical protein